MPDMIYTSASGSVPRSRMRSAAVETESKRAAFEEDLTAKIAWYYYIDNLTQQQIADNEKVGQRRISTSISEAIKKIRMKFSVDGKK